MQKKQKTINDEIQHVLLNLEGMAVHSQEYGEAVKNLKELCEARSKKTSYIVEPEVLVIALTNILGIVIVLNFEQLHVVASKAFGLVRRI